MWPASRISVNRRSLCVQEAHHMLGSIDMNNIHVLFFVSAAGKLGWRHHSA